MANTNSVTDIYSKLKGEIEKVSKTLNDLDINLNHIQTETNDKGSWNGINAFNVVQECLVQIDYNKNLLKELNKCADYLESIK